MDTFKEVYQELIAYFDGSAALDTVRDELLTFPKFPHVAMALHGIDGIERYGHVVTYLVRDGKTYAWQRDPIIGAIVRNKAHYAWTVQEREAIPA